MGNKLVNQLAHTLLNPKQFHNNKEQLVWRFSNKKQYLIIFLKRKTSQINFLAIRNCFFLLDWQRSTSYTSKQNLNHKHIANKEIHKRYFFSHAVFLSPSFSLSLSIFVSLSLSLSFFLSVSLSLFLYYTLSLYPSLSLCLIIV